MKTPLQLLSLALAAACAAEPDSPPVTTAPATLESHANDATPKVATEPALESAADPVAGDPAWAELKQEIRERFPDVAQLSVSELDTWIARGRDPVLIDVRAEEEYAVSHLPGALLAEDVETVLALLTETDPERPVVLYCSIGYRSSDLAAKLSRRGVRAHNLEGSIFEWANADHPVERAGRVVHEVHPYDEEWGRLLSRELWSFSAGSSR